MGLNIILLKILFTITVTDGKYSNSTTGDAGVCYTNECFTAANKLLQDMNTKVNPCDDFYEFACGSFISNNKLPGDKTEEDVFSRLNDLVEKKIRIFLEEPVTPHELHPFRLPKYMYQACINKDAREARGVTPLLKMLEKLGGWPVLSGTNWNENNFSWLETIYRLRESGNTFDSLFELIIMKDIWNTSSHTIMLTFPNIEYGIHLEKGLTDKSVHRYYKYMVDMATLLGANRSKAELELKESLEFESEIQKIIIKNQLPKNLPIEDYYDRMPIFELQRKVPKIHWIKMLNHLTAPFYTFKLHEYIITNHGDYFTTLEDLLEKTPKRVIANYMLWKVVAKSAHYLTDEIRLLDFDYKRIALGTNKQETIWKECTKEVKKTFSLSIGAMYIRRSFDVSSKDKVLEIFYNIRQQFRKTLEKADWMDRVTRKKALEKLEFMGSYIGYPDEMLDITKILKYYSNLQMSPDKYYENFLNESVFNVEMQIHTLKEPSNKTSWIEHSNVAEAEAYSILLENKIDFRAGILDGEFFSTQRPTYMNYASIGFAIAHEVIHGYDSLGRQIDKHGNVLNWWENSTNLIYHLKENCLINLYNNYILPEIGKNISGERSLTENIANHEGAKLAYDAYETWKQKYGEEPSLPGFEKYTKKQLFWLVFANTWCALYRNESLEKHILDDHIPARYRVIGPLSNSYEFANDYSCPVGTAMNPEHKCTVW